MKTTFCCRNKLRIEAIREHPSINGIEYLEVIDKDAPENDLRQRTLLVFCVKPLAAAPTLDQIHISGGVRISPIRIEWAAMASDEGSLASDGVIGSEEQDLLLGLDHPDRVVVVRVAAAGDYDQYMIRFGIDEDPLPDFDRICSEIAFSFKVECPSPFDCATACDTNQERLPGPFIDYQARDYDTFRQLMLDRMKITLPEWKDRNPADLGVTIIEALAYEADRLTWYQDAVSADAYLGTARTRTAVRRHARLLDYDMHDGCNARALVSVTVESNVTNLQIDKTLPTGERVRILTTLPGVNTVIAPEQSGRYIKEFSPLVFEPMMPARMFHAHNEIKFYTWGDEECCIHAGAVSAVLQDDLAGRVMLRPGDILVFEEVISPHTGQEADADPQKRHAVRLTKVLPEAVVDADGVHSAAPADRDPLYDVPVVYIEWDREDALPFTMQISARIELDGVASVVPDLSVARGNILLIDHGETLDEEELPKDTSHPDYRPLLDESDLTYGAAFDREILLPVNTLLAQKPHDALPHIYCTDGDGIQWEVRKTLFDSDPYDYHFVAETEDDGSTRLRFGDGIQGLKPPDTPFFTAVYRIGNGKKGNVGRDTLTHCVFTPGAGIAAVRNPLSVTNGVDPESRQEVKKYAPQAFRTQERAVTEKDYAEIARRHPDVQNALAVRRWTGSWHTIFLSIDRYNGAEVDDEFEAEMVSFLDQYRMAGRDVEIMPPCFVSLDIALNICVSQGYRVSDIHEELSDMFTSSIRRDGSKGYFHPDNFTFGTQVYLSPIIDTASGIEGVSRVTITPDASPPGVFMRWGDIQRNEIDEGVIAMGTSEIPRCMNDPNNPEYGRIVFHVEGGS